jgi:hypothetical protein
VDVFPRAEGAANDDRDVRVWHVNPLVEYARAADRSHPTLAKRCQDGVALAARDLGRNHRDQLGLGDGIGVFGSCREA